MEREPQINAIDKKIRSSHQLRRIVAGGVGAVVGAVGYLASIPVPHPEFQPLLFIPVLPLVLGGIGVTAVLKINEEKLLSPNKKTSKESAK